MKLKHGLGITGVTMIVIVLFLMADNYVFHPGFTTVAFIGAGIFFLFGMFLVIGDFMHKLD
jgi:hypothetical protein